MAESKVLDVPRIDFKVGESAFSPIASLVTSMKVFGEKITYPYMMGSSGAAFRLYWMKGFDPSSASVSSESPALLGARALGYSYYEYANLPDAEAWKLIVQSIDEGKPVPACGIVPPMEWQVVCGYTAGKTKKLHVESYYDPDPTKPSEVPFKTWEGWGSRGPAKNVFATFRKKGTAPSHHTVAFESLARAILLAHEHEFWVGPHGDGEAHEHVWSSGLVAYDAWIEDLKGEVKEKDAAKVLMANDLCAYTLQDARLCAAGFMDVLTGTFPSARARFEEAKEAYRLVADIVELARELVKYPWDQHPKVKPGDVKGFVDPAVRGKYAELLGKAQAQDRKAVAALETAVTMLH